MPGKHNMRRPKTLSAAGLPLVAYDTADPRFGAAADLVRIVGPVTTIAGSDIVSLNSYIGNCRIADGNRIELVSGDNAVFRGINRNSEPAANVEIGSPYELDIPGDPAGPYTGVIEAWINNHSVTLSGALPTGLSPETSGVRFSWGEHPASMLKAGQTIILQNASLRARPWVTVIEALLGNYQVRVSERANVSLQACYQTVIAGTDDSEAVNAAVAAAIARGDRYLCCSGHHYAPRLAADIANLNVIGTGALEPNPPETGNGSARHVKYIANLGVPAPLSFHNAFPPNSLPAMRLQRPIKVVIAGDSLAAEGPTFTSPIDCPAHAILQSIARLRPAPPR